MRGISYLADQVREADVRRDLTVIREELLCDAVSLKANDADRQLAAAAVALELGLDVWIEAQQENQRDGLEHLERVAVGAERLRVHYPGRVTLLVGNEYSLLTRGIVPGSFTLARLWLILRAGPLLRRRITRRLGRRLAAARTVARAAFGGPVTYAAALWEHVDWTEFDVVAVNLYRIGPDAEAYAARVRALVARSEKPVVITEFGCGCFRGAELAGPGSFQVVNWFRSPPRVKAGLVRDEQVQARYLRDLLDVFDASGVHGSFVFTFVMPEFPHDPDPVRDLDMAGFGMVKVMADGWERKAAFEALRAANARPRSGPGRGSA
ncbi:hypothetical protein DVA67_007490 [Solirubrobacter sp. CPCC 204708]|uniref:Abortive infection protein n=1 Tax=Solirubrobacter deserti TaxID=2282478 RepID=A0ABT4RKN8_9ACTN|nr:hypothetical protein [Solirubrobacter deserti]MBE2315814.1 hypothetical protein [Solirubrobacter deserti]MDA0138850.1 hypothetical protein [Solirubrobacter deserti]